MRRRTGVALIALLLAATRPIESRLRAEAPAAPTSARLGVGRLLGSVLTGAFRPLLLTYLWIRLDTLYGQGRMDELHANLRTLLTLYPNNMAAREYLGWSLAFNMKVEEHDPGIAWRYTRDGLDILAELDEGQPTLAYWFLVQCGQNATQAMRYAGAAWRDEFGWRARARAWGERTWGESLSRFELGLRALRGRVGFHDARRRADLSICLAYDEWIRLGTCPHADDIVHALRDYAQRVVDNPALARIVQGELTLILLVQARDLDKLAGIELGYRPAMALLSIGGLDDGLPKEERQRCLELAARTLDQLGEEAGDPQLYREELDMAVQWMEHLEDPTPQPPPLPFDTNR